MDPDTVQALVARYLTEPDFIMSALECASNHGKTEFSSDLDDLTIEAAAVSLLDADTLKRLKLFRGFIAKVRHSPLLSVLPYTFKLISIYNDELGFFASYATSYLAARRNGSLPIGTQIELLRAHATSYATRWSPDAVVLMSAIFEHEITIRTVSREPPGEAVTWPESAVVWKGNYAGRRYAFDILYACELIDRGAPNLLELSKQPTNLAYWRRNSDAETTFFELDALTATIFSFVNNKRSVREIVDALTRNGIDCLTLSDMNDFFESANAREFVRMS